MTKKKSIINLVVAALLCAIGVVIPMVMPGIRIEPMSFTLASHVPVFIAMMISPPVAVAVALGTALGFFFSATPVIAMRALSHVVFAFLGALWLKKHPLSGAANYLIFSLSIAVMHAICEVAVVCFFYFSGSLASGFYESGLFGVILLVGLGTIVHSMIDFALASAVAKPLQKIGMVRVFA